jgi:hypothetical protein
MSKLNERIEKIAEYFKGMKIIGDTIIVEVKFGHKWGTYPSDESETPRINVAQSEEEADVWFYYAKFNEVGLDEIFDLIENTIQMNKDALAKIELLKEKIGELKTLFEKENIETLQGLEFSLPKKRSSKRKNNKVKKDNKENTEVSNEKEEDVKLTEVTEEQISNNE